MDIVHTKELIKKIRTKKKSIPNKSLQKSIFKGHCEESQKSLVSELLHFNDSNQAQWPRKRFDAFPREEKAISHTGWSLSAIALILTCGNLNHSYTNLL